ncbi:hypothetical protein PROFUN_11773 [Planoprotostelium fungivorum]|uniref:Protein kinase domain-containing protein n=1 Tax=Planoprotostelium fungivorum TaxID=1890364 RepID=A0A2P6N8M4_9EUKA|nr:hypothetical protein PROFUN_11773 [Planoprotostelium fungivorum]
MTNYNGEIFFKESRESPESLPEKQQQTKPPLYVDDGDPNAIYELVREQAVGSFGTVYLAQKRKEPIEIVALKIITIAEDESFDELAIEIQVLRKCNHPNIVGFQGAWLLDEKELFIAMEFCTAGSLLEIYDDFPVGVVPCNEAQISFIMRETIKGLAYLHSLDIIHRDLKASNVLLSNAGQIKLADFGVSAQLTPERPHRNTLIGTPYWMAPEVINMDTSVPYDTRADIWALGITAIELAERNPPHVELAPMRALCLIPLEPPPTLKEKEKWKTPRRRPAADELMNHPFIRNCEETNLISLINSHRALQESESAGREMTKKFDALVEDLGAKSTTPKLTESKMDSNEDQTEEKETNSSQAITIQGKKETDAQRAESPPTNELLLSSNSVNSIGLLPEIGEVDKVQITRRGNKATVHGQSMRRPVTILVDETMRKNAALRLKQEKLVKIQLKQIRKLQEEHKKIEEQLDAKQQIELEAQQKVHQGRFRQKEKARVEAEANVMRQVMMERDSMKKDQAATLKKDQKNAADDVTKKKDMVELFKNEIKEEKERQKMAYKGKKIQWKSQGLDKVQRKQAKKGFHEEQQTHDIRFQNSHHFQKCIMEHKNQMDTFDKLARKHLSLLEDYTLHYPGFLRREQNIKMESLGQLHDVQMSAVLSLQEMEQSHLKQRHHLQLDHLKQVLELQRQQQESALRSEKKVKMKEYRKGKNERRSSVMSLLVKSGSRALGKSTSDLTTRANKETAYENELDQQYLHEMEKLRNGQEGQYKAFMASQEKELRELQTVHLKAESDLQEQQQNEKKQMLSDIQTKIVQQQREVQGEEKKEFQEVAGQMKSLLSEQQNQQLILVNSHHAAELTAYCQFSQTTTQLIVDQEATKSQVLSRIKAQQTQQAEYIAELERGINARHERQIETLREELSLEHKNMMHMAVAQKEAKKRALDNKYKSQSSLWIVNHVDKSGQTRLHLACAANDLHEAQNLVDEGIDINIQDKGGWTALHCAAHAKSKEIVSFLLQQEDIDVQLVNRNGTTALHYFCKLFDESYYDDVKEDIITLFVDKGANLDAQNEHGESILHNAVLSHNLSVVTSLLKGGADVNVVTDADETPLHWAVRVKNNFPIIKELIHHGADPNAVGKHGLALTIYKDCDNEPQVVQLLEEYMRKRKPHPGAAKRNSTVHSASNSPIITRINRPPRTGSYHELINNISALSIPRGLAELEGEETHPVRKRTTTQVEAPKEETPSLKVPLVKISSKPSFE